MCHMRAPMSRIIVSYNFILCFIVPGVVKSIPIVLFFKYFHCVTVLNGHFSKSVQNRPKLLSFYR